MSGENHAEIEIKSTVKEFLEASQPSSRYSLFDQLKKNVDVASRILLDFLSNDDKILRQRAIWALGELRFIPAYDSIRQLFEKAEQPTLKANAIEALAKIDPERAGSIILGAIIEEKGMVNQRAQWIRKSIYNGSIGSPNSDGQEFMEKILENEQMDLSDNQPSEESTEADIDIEVDAEEESIVDENDVDDDRSEEDVSPGTFVPPHFSDYRLNIELVPNDLWGSSLYQQCKDAGNLSKWRKMKKELFEKEGKKCWICGETEGRLIVHTFWFYDDYDMVRNLEAIHHICKMCEKVRMIGKWLHAPNNYSPQGNWGIRSDITAHFCKVNYCDEDDFRSYESSVMGIWERRCQYFWDQDFKDYSYLVEE